MGLVAEHGVGHRVHPILSDDNLRARPGLLYYTSDSPERPDLHGFDLASGSSSLVAPIVGHASTAPDIRDTIERPLNESRETERNYWMDTLPSPLRAQTCLSCFSARTASPSRCASLRSSARHRCLGRSPGRRWGDRRLRAGSRSRPPGWKCSMISPAAGCSRDSSTLTSIFALPAMSTRRISPPVRSPPLPADT